MKIRIAKKVLGYSRKDKLATLPEFADSRYSRRTRKAAARRYEKWLQWDIDIDEWNQTLQEYINNKK